MSHLTRCLGVLAVVNGTIGQRAILARLRDLLRDSDFAQVRWVIERAIGDMGDAVAVPEVLGGLLELTEVRSVTARAIGDMGDAVAVPEVLGGLLEMATEPNRMSVMDHGVAVDALAKMGKAAGTSEVIGRLLTLLRDSEDDILRGSVARALPKICSGESTPEIVDRLVEALADKSKKFQGNVASDCADPLGAMGRAAATPEVLDRLLELIRDPDGNVSRSAAHTLAKLGKHSDMPEILARLSETLVSPDDTIRSNGIYALGIVASEAGAGTGMPDRFFDMLSDPSWEIRSKAAEASGRMGRDAARPDIVARLVGLLSDLDGAPGVHYYAMLIDLSVEGFAQGDGVRTVGGANRSGSAVLVEPEMNFIEEVKSRPVNQLAAARLVLRAKEDGGSKDALEALHHAVVVAAILGKAEELQHLGGAIEVNGPAFLPEGEGGHPDRDEAILAEGNGVIGVRDNLKEEVPIAALVKELVFGERA
ncbi:MAG: HEAT repeat domain-containing protein [Terriglobia bacterium]